MIWCVTLNPSLDITYDLTDNCTPGAIHRVRSVWDRPGGKGNNAARVIATLGHAVTAVGIYGALVGAQVRHLLSEQDIPLLWEPCLGETRRCITILAPNGLSEIREAGPFMATEVGAKLLYALCERVNPHDWVTLSGSLPVDWPDDTYQTWITHLQQKVQGIIVDTSGPPLEYAMRASPTIIVPNLDEYKEIQYVPQHSSHIITTMGAGGAVWRPPESSSPLKFVAPVVSVVNSVGAGDAFLGGIVSSLDEGCCYRDAIRFAVAVGTASVLTPAVADIDLQAVPDLYAQVTIREEQ